MENKYDILTRLYAAHSALFSFSNTKTITEYMFKLLKFIPGISSCLISIDNYELSSENFPIATFAGLTPREEQINFNSYEKIYSKVKELQQSQLYPIRSSSKNFGYIIVFFNNKDVFIPFDPVLNSFVISISTILENIAQKKELRDINHQLEEKVLTRTKSLNITKNKLKLVLEKTIKALAVTVEIKDPLGLTH